MYSEQSIETILKNGENSFVEFKAAQSSPVSLAEEIVAFSNTKGGIILIGVNDDGSIKGIEDKKRLEEWVMNVCRNNVHPPVIPLYEPISLQDKWICKITILEGMEKPYATLQGKYLLRAGTSKRLSSREELLRLFQNAHIHHIDDRPLPESSIGDLEQTKIAQYFQDCYEVDWKGLSLEEKETLLLNACILAQLGEKNCTTISGLLFFGKKQQILSPLEKYLPQAGIVLAVYRSDEMDELLDRFQSYDSSPEIIDHVVQKLKIHWKTPSRIEGMLREENPFPSMVFREILVNAIVHREYSIRANIQIRIFPSRIEILSPGRLVNTVTIAKMKAGISVPRNPILLKFMENYRYADHLGRGIPMIIRKIQKMKGFAIELHEDEEQFRIVLLLNTEGY
jgi:ATP-dependent DNA helicase RecG